MKKTINHNKITIEFEGEDTIEARRLMEQSIEKTFTLLRILNSLEA